MPKGLRFSIIKLLGEEKAKECYDIFFVFSNLEGWIN